jgi:hypothetical protein
MEMVREVNNLPNMDMVDTNNIEWYGKEIC